MWIRWIRIRIRIRIRNTAAKMNQQEATRAGEVSWLRAGRTVKEIMRNGDFNKNTVYNGKWKYDKFAASRGFSDIIMIAR